MPLSLKSSSIYLLVCLSTSWAFAQEPLHCSVEALPLYDIGNALYLASSYSFKEVYGSFFPHSFLGSSSDYYLTGKGNSLAFSRCQVSVASGSTLISAVDDLVLTRFSKLLFEENVSPTDGGLIVGKNITIRDCQSIIFKDNVTHYAPVVIEDTTTPATKKIQSSMGSSVQFKEQLMISGITKYLNFENNSGNFGSALLASSENSVMLIENNSAAILFSKNLASCGGGAIYNGSVIFSENTGHISFFNNVALNSLVEVVNSANPPTTSTATIDASNLALGCGGAINSPTRSVEFIRNRGECSFQYNLAETAGGAIYANSCIFNNLGPLTFSKNSTPGNGGAICAKSLTIVAEADVVFSKNRAKEGGAVYLAGDVAGTTGEAKLRLEARGGNIVFKDNVTDSLPGERRAIYLKDAVINGISAYGHSSIFFYDPIKQEATTNPPVPANYACTINGHGADGSVVFTGETLTEAEKVYPENYTTTLIGPLTVGGGRLIVTNNAFVTSEGLTATNGQLVLGSGAAVGKTNAAVTVSASNLGIDIDSFLSKEFSVAKVNGNTISLSGPVHLVTSNIAELYDNPMLSTSLSVPFIQPSSASGFTAGDINVEDHYGYQGSWSSTTSVPVLAPTPAGKIPSNITNGIYVLWTPTIPYKAEYILDPQRRGELVPNSLWMSFFSMKHFSNGLREARLSRHVGWVTSAQAIGNYAIHYRKNGKEGFSGKYGGYQALATMHYITGSSIGLAFGQLYGCLKSRPYDCRSNGNFTVATFFGSCPVITERAKTIIRWEGSYGYAVHRMRSQYANPLTQIHQIGRGRWHNNLYYIEVSAEHPFFDYIIPTRHIAREMSLMGFASFELVGGWQNSFRESGELARSFGRGRGHSICMPIGFTTQFNSPFRLASSHINLRMVYRPDLYRVIPHDRMTIIANGEVFSIRGADVARHGFLVEANQSLKLGRKGTVFINYSLDLKESQTNQHLSAGLSGKF